MILITTQCFPPRIGGIESLLRGIALGLHGLGYAVEVLADATGGDDGGFDRSAPFPVVRFGGFKPWRRRRKARAVRARAGRGRAVLLADSWKSLELVDTKPCALRLCLVHGTEINHPGKPRRLARIRAVLSRADALIANSEFTARLARETVAPDTPVTVIPPGIAPPMPPEPALRERLGRALEGRSPRLLSLCRLTPRKGIREAIQILPDLVRAFPGLVYHIGGEGGERRGLEALVRESGLDKHVVFTGALREREKAAYFDLSDLFLMPGRQAGNDVEGFGIACLEAAAHGLPAVAGGTGGAAEAVVDGETGLLCDAADPRALRAALLALLDDPARRRALGAKARARAGEFYWDKTIRRYQALIERGLA